MIVFVQLQQMTVVYVQAVTQGMILIVIKIVQANVLVMTL